MSLLLQQRENSPVVRPRFPIQLILQKRAEVCSSCRALHFWTDGKNPKRCRRCNKKLEG